MLAWDKYTLRVHVCLSPFSSPTPCLPVTRTPEFLPRIEGGPLSLVGSSTCAEIRNNLWVLALFFHDVGSRDWPKVLGSKYFYLLSHLINSLYQYIYIYISTFSETKARIWVLAISIMVLYIYLAYISSIYIFLQFSWKKRYNLTTFLGIRIWACASVLIIRINQGR